ncbi:MAG: hypothetical protein ACI4B5_05315 [Bacteroidaceae bacterium]
MKAIGSFQRRTVSYGCTYRLTIKDKGLAVVTMVVVAIIAGTWWYAYVYWTKSVALSAVIQKESGSWMNHIVRPWWHYWKFLLETGIWSLLLLMSTFLPLADKQRRKSCR